MAAVANYGGMMNGFAWRLFSRVSENDPDRPPDTGVGAATIVQLLGGVSLGAGASGSKEADQLINGGQVEVVGQELMKQGENRTCFKWFPVPLVLVPSGRPIRPDFIEQAKTKFGVDVRSVDMKTESGRQVIALINEVTEEKSEGHTEEMITPDYQLREDDGVVTTAAIYFHPWWNVTFDRKKTADAAFFEAPGRERRVGMMYREEVLPYTEGEVASGVKVQMVGLACRRNAGMVYFVLPSKRFGLREVIRKASAESLSKLMAACVPRSVCLWLPKIRMTETVQLRGFLGEMGLKAWLGSGLSGIMDDGGTPLKINEVLQQTVVRFNEDGDMAETGEKTEVESSAKSASSIKVRCDHPFLFVFRHDATGAFWLIGTSARPIYPRK